MTTMVWGGGTMRFALRLALPLLFLVVTGCGPKTAKVSGTVLYDGKPLPGGRVTFRPEDPKRNSVMVELDEQGNYQTELPVGEVQVSVDNRELEPVPAAPAGGLPDFLPAEARQKLSGAAKSGDAPADAPPPNAPDKLPGKYVPIPERYYTIEKSGLKFTVHGPEQKQNIELTR